MQSADRLRLEVAHTVVYVHDVDKMIAFYRDVLGFEVADRGPLGKNEIVFLSQIANHHHQVAFITGRPDADKSNSVHHTAYRSAGTLDDLRGLAHRPRGAPRSERHHAADARQRAGRSTSRIRSTTASRCSSTRLGTCSNRRRSRSTSRSPTTRSSRRHRQRSPTRPSSATSTPSTTAAPRTSRTGRHLSSRRPNPPAAQASAARNRFTAKNHSTTRIADER